MKKTKLDPKRARFVQEYLIDLNVTQAAIRAGYSKKTANKNASRLMVNDGVQKKIAAAMKKRSGRTEITQDRVLQELACIGFLDPKAIFEDDGSIKQIKDMPEKARRAISSIEVAEIFDNADGDQGQAIGLAKKIRFNPKVNSLELIGKHLGMFNDVNIKGRLDLNMVLSISDLKKSMDGYKKQ